MKTLSNPERRKAGLLGLSFAIVGDGHASKQCFRAAFTGQWEGYQRNRLRDRPGRRTASQDTDLNYGVREDLLSEARSLVQTEPVAKRVVNQYSDHVVGKCLARWDTGDDNINQQYRDNWKSWMKVCDYRGQHHFTKLMKLAVGPGMVCDGRIFIEKVKGGQRPQINLIEADRVSSAGIFNTDTDSMVGGILLDPVTRRQKAIRVWDRTLYGTFQNSKEIPAANYLHLFDSTRADAITGVTGFHAVLNALRDKKEINAAELAKTKRNSKLALIAKTLTGQAPNSNIDPFGEGSGAAAVPAKASVEEISDAATAYMFPGEDVKTHDNNSPSSAWMGHMEFIIRHIALGLNLPFGVVWNMGGLGKPGVLFELEQAARTIAAVQDELESKVIVPIIGWLTACDIAAGRLPFHPLWYKFQVSRPAYISIDAGRDSKSAMAENLLGMKSATKWYAESGDEFEEEADRCCYERSYLEKRAKFHGVDVNTVRMMTPNGNPNVIGGTGADPD